jgi:nitrous oxidase accessory protein NosD
VRLALVALLVAAAHLSLPASPARAASICYVDSTSGNDGTGVCGDNTKPFATIQAAVTAATAGDTIQVAAGTYGGGAVVTKALTIRGAQYGASCARDDNGPAGESTIDGTSSAGAGIGILTAGGVTITGLRFVNVTNAVAMLGTGPGVAITNNVMVIATSLDTSGGVLAGSADELLISCNTVIGAPGSTTSHGARVQSSGTVEIQANRITGVATGLFIDGVTDLTIQDNDVRDVQAGIGVRGCTGDCLIADNVVDEFVSVGINAGADVLRNTVEHGEGGSAAVITGSGWRIAENRFSSTPCPIDPQALDVQALADACDAVLYVHAGATGIVIEQNVIEVTGSAFGRGIAFWMDNHNIVVRNNFIIAGPVGPAIHVAGFTIDIWGTYFGPLLGEFGPEIREALELLIPAIAFALNPFGAPTAHSGLSFTENHFSGGSGVGLVVEAGVHTGTVDAERNWWASATGPSGTGPGTGKSTVDADGVVDFDPWLCSGADTSPLPGFQPGTPCDTTPPVIQFYPEKLLPNGRWVPYGGEWHSGIVRVRVVCVDPGPDASGIKSDSTPARFWFEQDGTWTVAAGAVAGWRCRDAAGNIAADGPSAPIVVRVDRRAPNCTVTPSPASFKRTLAWQTVNVTLDPGAAPSGVDAIWLHSISGSAADRSGWAIGTEDYSGQLRGGGIRRSYTLTYAVRDKAGNVGYCSAIVKAN